MSGAKKMRQIILTILTSNSCQINAKSFSRGSGYDQGYYLAMVAATCIYRGNVKISPLISRDEIIFNSRDEIDNI